MRREPALNSSSSHRSTRPSRSCAARHSAVLVLEMDGMPLVSMAAALSWGQGQGQGQGPR